MTLYKKQVTRGWQDSLANTNPDFSLWDSHSPGYIIMDGLSELLILLLASLNCWGYRHLPPFEAILIYIIRMCLKQARKRNA